MKFDKSKVYTALNADELKVGSKVIAADDLEHLKHYVEHDSQIEALTGICSADAAHRFTTAKNDWNLVYFVEEPARLKWTDLKVGDVITDGKMKLMVTAVSTLSSPHIYAGLRWLTDKELEEWEKVEK